MSDHEIGEFRVAVSLEDGCLALLRNRKDREGKRQNCITWMQDKGFREAGIIIWRWGCEGVCVFGRGSNRERKFNLSEDSIRLQLLDLVVNIKGCWGSLCLGLRVLFLHHVAVCCLSLPFVC